MLDGSWIDSYLLAGPDDEICLEFDEPVSRGSLRAQVAARADELRAGGLRPEGTICLRLPPGVAYVVSLLAALRTGAQVSLLDHRLTQHEATRALASIAPQFVVSAPDCPNVPLRGYATVRAATTTYPGRPAATEHCLLQLSSGSTGMSKAIGRTADSLIAEVERYKQIDGTPLPGERIVLLASMVHVLGLVGGLFYGLHRRARLALPRQLTVDAILRAVAAAPEPATVLGVPVHVEMLTAAHPPARPAQLKRMTVGGELIRAGLWQTFTDYFAAPLGNMYGMTELGVIATDLFGEHRPALRPAPGMVVRGRSGELVVAAAASPYVGRTAPGRWVDGWLYTRDAGKVDPATGLVMVRGRLDSQVSVGGLKVDLAEVEHVVAGVPGVAEAVVVFDGAIEAFVVLTPTATLAGLKEAMAERLAPYKRPRRLNVVTRLPRTPTGKLIRNVGVLAEAAR